METFFVVLGWTWRVLVNVLVVFVVLYVFSRLQGRTEFILVSVLGLIYVTLRTMAYGQVQMFAGFAVAIDKELTHLRYLLQDDIDARREAIAESEKAIGRQLAKGYMDLVFLSLVTLICLFNLFTIL